MKSNVMKAVLFGLLIAYVVSPVDLCVGPIDDIIAIVVYVLCNKRGVLCAG